MRVRGIELKQALQKLGLKQEEAAIRLGISRPTVSIWCNKDFLTVDIITQVKEMLDIDLTKDKVDTEPDSQLVALRKNKPTNDALIPFYNIDFIAGNSELFYGEAVIHPDYYMDVPEFYGCTAFRAYSDSMENKIKSGAILFAIKLDDWRSHLEYGQIYGITCTDGRRYLKYIKRDKDNKDNFLLVSENEHYEDFEIPKEKIKNIWLIEGWVNKTA